MSLKESGQDDREKRSRELTIIIIYAAALLPSQTISSDHHSSVPPSSLPYCSTLSSEVSEKSISLNPQMFL